MIQKSTLDNRIRVVTEHIPGAHSVSVGVWVQNGSRHEPSPKNGISHFLEHMLFKGTEHRSPQDIAREIDSVGGVLNAFTGREYSCYYAKVLAKHFPLALDLLSDIVLNSVFDLDEIEKERRVILQEIHMVEDTPDDQVHDLFSQNFWKGHPLGQSVLGTGESVRGLSREDLLQVMSERYQGENIVICVAGGLEDQPLVDQISEAFQNVPSSDKPLPVCTLPQFQRQVNISGKALEQVHICLGTRALPQDHPNRFSCYLLNTILGGSMSSRLFQTIREDLGLAYSTYSYLNCHSDAGALVLFAATSPDDAVKVVALMLKELLRFRQESISAAELFAAKEQLKGHLLLSMDSTDNRMTRLAKNEIYMGCNISLKEVLHGFDRVTSEDILRLAEFILQDDYLGLQLVGNAKDSDFPLVDLTLG